MVELRTLSSYRFTSRSKMSDDAKFILGFG